MAPDPKPLIHATSTVIDLTGEAPPEMSHNIEEHAAAALSDVTFDSFDLPTDVMRGIEDLGFTHCTPIQAAALPHTLAGRDLMAQAQTGTGKTACFLLTIFKEFAQTERTSERDPRAVVVAPTRELAIQIGEDAEAIGRWTDYHVVTVYGGMDWQKQARELEEPVDLLVGTPGRMMDYMRRGIVDLRHCRVVVLDEADRMLDMGFIDDIRFILSRTPSTRTTLLFSATLPFSVVKLARRFLRDPQEIKIDADRVAAATVEQVVYHVAEFEKLQFILWLLEEERPERCLVFVNTKRTGEWLHYKLWHNGWDAEYISGDVAQKTRLRLVERFKHGEIEIMVATDVAARGLHVEDIDLVINVDLPEDAPDYVHRIGRTGRAGATGKAISIADERLVAHLPAIEKYIGYKLPAIIPDDGMFLRDEAPSFREAGGGARGGRSAGRGGRSAGQGGRSAGRGGRSAGRGGRSAGRSGSMRSGGRRSGGGDRPWHGEPRDDRTTASAAPEQLERDEGRNKPKRKRRRRRDGRGRRRKDAEDGRDGTGSTKAAGGGDQGDPHEGRSGTEGGSTPDQRPPDSAQAPTKP